MNLRRLFLTFNAFQFFFSLLLWVPIFYEYQKRIGLSDVEIFRIQSLYYLIFCLLEIPTGYLADWLGYRLCLILGSFTLILANLEVPFFPSFHGFLFHFILIALARSFVSGASSAYLYETLRARSALEEYKEAEGRARSYSLMGKVVCWALVGPIMQFHLTLPYWLTALNAAIGLYFAWALPEARASQDQSRVSIFELGRVLKGNPRLVLIMIQGVSIFVLARICQVNLFQPILERKGFAVASYGMVMALMTVFEAAGSFRSKWVRTWLNDLNAVSVLTAILGFSFLLMSMNGPELRMQGVTIAALCVFSYVIGISFPIQRQLINEAIPEPRLRASILSSESIMDRAVNSVAAAGLGATLQAGQLGQYLQKCAMWSVGSVLTVSLMMRLMERAKK